MKANGKKFTLVEVLSEENFAASHIPGAINLPLGKIKDIALEYIKPDETVAVYCSGYACNASTEAAKILLELGYEKVLDFKAGKKGWENAGLEFEK
ncbi:MAG: rhodanese-like domain-containing protein [Candidatus Diapherotrites archaeon]|nr:rhodanese-like domain-containing protein [Candidatus Diapherotrites archaeon]